MERNQGAIGFIRKLSDMLNADKSTIVLFFFKAKRIKS